MRLISLIVGLLVTVSMPAVAQDAPRVEVFGGYSYLRPDGGGNLHGWNASIAGNLNARFGLAADFSGHYGSQTLRVQLSGPQSPGLITATSDSNASLYLLLFGPRFSHRKNEKITPFVHALFGAAHLRTQARIEFGDLALESPFASTAFAMAVGGGVDLKLTESMGLRLIQAEYVLTRFGRGTQNSVRLSVGLLLH